MSSKRKDTKTYKTYEDAGIAWVEAHNAALKAAGLKGMGEAVPKKRETKPSSAFIFFADAVPKKRNKNKKKGDFLQLLSHSDVVIPVRAFAIVIPAHSPRTKNAKLLATTSMSSAMSIINLREYRV